MKKIISLLVATTLFVAAFTSIVSAELITSLNPASLSMSCAPLAEADAPSELKTFASTYLSDYSFYRFTITAGNLPELKVSTSKATKRNGEAITAVAAKVTVTSIDDAEYDSEWKAKGSENTGLTIDGNDYTFKNSAGDDSYKTIMNNATISAGKNKGDVIIAEGGSLDLFYFDVVIDNDYSYSFVLGEGSNMNAAVYTDATASSGTDPYDITLDGGKNNISVDTTAISLPMSGTTYVTDIDLSTNELNLTVGGTQTLTATLTPNDPDDPSITWSSSDDTVATVSSAGVVEAVAAGTATITATANGSDPGQPAVTAQCTVNVSAATTYVTDIDLSENELALTLGSSSTLTANLTPSTPTDSTVTWTTSNPSIATVSNGTVLATGVGIATITATAVGSNPASSVSAQCTVTVTNPATGITIDGDKNKSIRVDEAPITLTATTVPSVTTDPVVWSSSDNTIATVNASTGVVTPVAKGTVTITATAGSVSDTCTLKVLGVATSPAIEEGVKAAEAYQKTKAGLTNLAGDPIDALQKNYKPALFSTSINEAAKRYFVRVTVTKEETHPTHDFEFSFAGQGINAEGDFQFVAIAKNSNYAIDSIELVVVDR